MPSFVVEIADDMWSEMPPGDRLEYVIRVARGYMSFMDQVRTVRYAFDHMRRMVLIEFTTQSVSPPQFFATNGRSPGTWEPSQAGRDRFTVERGFSLLDEITRGVSPIPRVADPVSFRAAFQGNSAPAFSEPATKREEPIPVPPPVNTKRRMRFK